MAIIPLIPDVMTEAGLVETVNSGLGIANTYTVRNNGKMFLHVKNTGATPTVVTLVANGVVAGHALAAGTVTVPVTTGDKLIGPFPSAVYDDGNHDVSFTFSIIAGVTVAVIQLPA